MHITLECYGLLTEICGDRCELALAEENPTVATVLDALGQAFPAVLPYLPQLACARGDELIKRSAIVGAGETLALLPPVSGG